MNKDLPIIIIKIMILIKLVSNSKYLKLIKNLKQLFLLVNLIKIFVFIDYWFNYYLYKSSFYSNYEEKLIILKRSS